ncbi:helix-turn-helix transcriptional regulator [Cellulomonas sp. NPDC055163]
MARSAVSTPFVARADEVRRLTDALGRAGAGQPGVVLLGADAGVGKTRLLRRAAELAEQAGATVVTVHCVDLGEIGLPYLPFAEALARLRDQVPGVVEPALDARPVLTRLVPARRGAGLAAVGAGGHAGAGGTGPGGTGAGRAGGEQGAPPDDARDLGPGEDQAGRLQLFDGIAAVLGAVGRPGAPLLLVIEDLHWADASSRDVLRFLVARLRDEHLLVVASYRTDDLHRRHPLRPMLAEMSRHPRVERIDLPAFTRDELREFAAAFVGHPLPEADLLRVAERSEGNAYFAEELLDARSGPETLPWTLADVLRARLEHLDPAVQQLARIASVAGRRVTEPLLRAVAADPEAGFGTRSVDDALREAVAHHVLVGEEGRIAFRHALLAEAVYTDLLPGEQVALHRAYLRALRAEPSLGPLSRLVVHALESHDLPVAVDGSWRAAQDAACVLAPAEELRHLETVLRLWESVPGVDGLVGVVRVDVLERAADAASRSGQVERAITLAREAVAAAEDDPRRRVALRTELARHLLAADHELEALRNATRALEDDPEPRQLGWVLATHARASLRADRDDDARASATRAVEVAREHGEAAAESDALATLAVLVVDDPAHAAELLTTAERRARDAGDLVTVQRCTYNLATTLYYDGQLGEASRVIARGLDESAATGLAWTEFGVALRFFGELVRYALGDLTPARLGSEPLIELQPGLMASVGLYAAVARGDADAVTRGRAFEPGWERDAQIALLSGGCLIDALTWSGEVEEAASVGQRLIDHLGRTWSETFLGAIWLAALTIAALADDAHGRRLVGADAADLVEHGTALLARAARVAERGRPRGGRLGPEGRAWLARAHAEHARLVGADDPALWRAARDAYAYGYRYEVARCEWRWAAALLDAGDRAAATEHARIAHEEAESMGARPLAGAVRDLARRGRLDLPGVRPTGVDVLTAREAEVLRLVARGLSNRQIGEELFISAKTVSVHVSNLLAKLGASGRTEAATLAHRRGLLDGS